MIAVATHNREVLDHLETFIVELVVVDIKGVELDAVVSVVVEFGAVESDAVEHDAMELKAAEPIDVETEVLVSTPPVELAALV